MRCLITLTIISAVTLSAAHFEDSAQFSSSFTSIQPRDSDHRNSLHSRSPVPGVAPSSTYHSSKPKDVNHTNGIHTSPDIVVAPGKTKPTRRLSDLLEPDRSASIERLERQYGFKNMGLPPIRHIQSAPGLEKHGNPWSPLRDRKNPYHTTSQSRAAYFEHNSGLPSAARPKFSSGPADSMVRYDVLARKPGDPGYIAPSAFRTSRVLERSAISVPSRKPPRQRNTESRLSNYKDKRYGCFACFGLPF